MRGDDEAWIFKVGRNEIEENMFFVDFHDIATEREIINVIF